MNTDERPPFSKGENSKQPGNRREIKRSPPARRIGEGRALLPHLDSISFMTCRAAANSAEAPPAAGMSPLPVDAAGACTPSTSEHPEPPPQQRRLAPHPGSFKAHKNKQLGVHSARRAAIPRLGREDVCRNGAASAPLCKVGWGALQGLQPRFETFPTPLQSLSRESDTGKRSSWQQMSPTNPLRHQMRKSTKVRGDARSEAAAATAWPRASRHAEPHRPAHECSLVIHKTLVPLKRVTLGHIFEKY